MRTRKTLQHLGMLLIIAVSASTVSAQDILDSLSRDESRIVSAIAPYPADMRAAILDVSQYPQVLVKLERTQARSSQAFQDAIADYPRDLQEKFYQGARFPDLNRRLMQLGKGQATLAQSIINEAPEGAQQALLDVYTNHFDALARIDKLYQSAQSALERITARYSPQVQQDFQTVIGNPDVMNLLTDNIDLTVSLGASYKEDPKGVVSYLDSLNVELNNQDASDLADYKKAVETDPKLRNEMEQAATEFAQQYDGQSDTPPVANNNYYGSAPYPYWFGYPYWYSSAMWYPMPYYYNTGFYYGAGGNLVVFGLPSFAYANWFFGSGFYHYPGLYRYYNSYYNVNRTNIVNRNVYRGFNTAALDHFSRMDPVHGQATRTDGNRTRASTLAPNSNTAHTFRQPVTGRQFNNNSVAHYNANAYHSMGWQHMQSGGFHSGMSGGFHGGMSAGMSGSMHGRR